MLLTVRPKHFRFMGGAVVFPGGSMTPEDADPRWESLSDLSAGEAAGRLGTTDAAVALGLHVCAARESFEEVGYLPATGRVECLRTADADDPAGFRERCLELGIRLNLRDLRVAGRWVTPFGSPVRFDTRFFVTPVAEAWEPQPNEEEVAGWRWASPRDALKEVADGDSIMAPPTVAMLQQLADRTTVADVMASLAPDAVGAGRSIYTTPLSPFVRVVLAPNPGTMTGPGTNTYLVGEGPWIVIDPAVDDERYLEVILEPAPDVAAIVITHRHSDHTGGAAALAGRSGARLFAFSPDPIDGEPVSRITDGEVFETGRLHLEALHAPGHAADHLCLWEPTTRSLFAGDNVLGEGTSVIAPPDGDMAAYLATLHRLRALHPERIYPGHFRPLEDGSEVLDRYIAHRADRESKIVAALGDAPASVEEIVGSAYDDTPVELHPVAQMSALAHLQKLETEGRAVSLPDGWMAADVE